MLIVTHMIFDNKSCFLKIIEKNRNDFKALSNGICKICDIE